MDETKETTEEKDGTTAPMVMNLPSNIGNIDTDDISLPLSLIKGLRRKSLGPSIPSTNAMDSSTSSNNTSDKDDSGGDEEGGSNTSSTSKPNDMVGTLSVGQISSLSGSEQESNNRGRVGILRVGGNTNGGTGFSSSSDENITGDDELSEKVVVRGKSVTSSQQQEQVQYKVSFAEGHVSKKSKNGTAADGDDAAVPASPKRKRSQEKNKSSPAAAASTSRSDEKKSAKRPRTAEPQEFKNNSIPFPVSDSSGNEGGTNGANGHEKQHEQRNGGAPSRAISSSSSTTASGQDPGQASSSSPLYSQTEGPMEQDNATTKTDTSMSSPQLTSKNDQSKFASHSPSSPSKEQIFQDSEERRRERNQREKERSNKIASQVDTLRCLLQRGGLFIPKKTKSSVLSEASNYIKTLQDRQQMMSMEMENLKCQLVQAVAARNQQQQMQASVQEQSDGGAHDYQLIFKNTIAGMCVASMGGALLDCNAAFEKETGLSQAKLGEMTIFNMIHANDLQRALDLISRMIDTGYVVGQGGNNAAAAQAPPDQQEPLLLQSSFASRPELGLCVTLVRGVDTMPKCFSVTLVKNVGSGLSNGNRVPFNPALPTVPSMPIESSITPAVNAHQQIHVPATQAPVLPAAAMPVKNQATPSGNGMAMNGTPVAGVASAAQGHTVPGLTLPQAAAPQASLTVPQPASTVPPQQLLQLILLQQMQSQGQTPVAQQQQIPIAQQQVPQVQQQPQLQQYQQQLTQLSQAPPPLPPVNNALLQNPTAWNTQNLAMLPQLQQILKPPGSNSSSQGSDREENDGVQAHGLIQPQATLPAQGPGYLNVQNPPVYPNGSTQGSKNSGEEGDNNRPWYYAG